jgi:protease-4
MRTEEARSPTARRKRQWKAAWLTGGLLFLVASGLVGIMGGGSDIGPRSGHIARIDIQGPIMEAEPTVELLEQARESDDTEAVLLRINSPGGGVGASEAIYEAVSRLAEDKPVAVSMGATAASGGYMAALGADRIYALNASMTGSIGVILVSSEIHGLMDKVGVDFRILKSGQYKDAGTPFRKMDEADRQYLQSLIDRLHGQFTRLVVDERGLGAEKVAEVADGRAFTGERARELGLIDAIGDRRAALRWLRKKADVDADTPVEQLKPPRRWMQRLLPEGLTRLWNRMVSPGPKFLYSTAPGSFANG